MLGIARAFDQVGGAQYLARLAEGIEAGDVIAALEAFAAEEA